MSTRLDTHAVGTPPGRDVALEEPEPTHYWSTILEEDFWVCATEAQAAAFRKEQQVVYLPDEVWLLCELKARDAANFPAKPRAIHWAKQAFGAVLSAHE